MRSMILLGLLLVTVLPGIATAGLAERIQAAGDAEIRMEFEAGTACTAHPRAALP